MVWTRGTFIPRYTKGSYWGRHLLSIFRGDISSGHQLHSPISWPGRERGWDLEFGVEMMTYMALLSPGRRSCNRHFHVHVET